MTDSGKIRDFNAAKAALNRKKQSGGTSTTRRGAMSKDEAYERALSKQKGRTFGGSQGLKWHHYVQFLLLLGLVSWLMKSCGG